MKNTFLIITSIASQDHPVLKTFAHDAPAQGISFIVVGDTKSPEKFNLDGCDFYSVARQQEMKFALAETLPWRHYARKNLGYLVAISSGAEIIIETDDDNLPLEGFWHKRTSRVQAKTIQGRGWINVYKYFTDLHIWPRGFALEEVMNELPEAGGSDWVNAPIQQGLADENPDVDAIYRLTMPLPVTFRQSESVALGNQTICPFNSQNTTWFREAFPLLYLPSYCSFRMTDIWRSFVAQRIAWSCEWSVLFTQSTVRQLRNDHNLMNDFRDEISGYQNNYQIMKHLNDLELANGVENIGANMVICYQKLIELNLIGKEEMDLLKRWIRDVSHGKEA